jgi:hypothetical protein
MLAPVQTGYNSTASESEMESDVIVIGHAGHEQVKLQILKHAGDAWRTAHVDVACGTWRGSFRWDFMAGELSRFGREIEQLYHSLSGTAILNPIEPNLTMKFVGDGRGHIAVSGVADADLYNQTCLTFRFLLDQTELPDIASALIRADD